MGEHTNHFAFQYDILMFPTPLFSGWCGAYSIRESTLFVLQARRELRTFVTASNCGPNSSAFAGKARAVPEG